MHEAQSGSPPVSQCTTTPPPHHLWHPGPNVINLRRGNCPHPELTASLTSRLPLPVVNASGCGPLITACLTSPLFTLLLTARKHIKTRFSSQSARCVNRLSECRTDHDKTCKILWYQIKMKMLYMPASQLIYSKYQRHFTEIREGYLKSLLFFDQNILSGFLAVYTIKQ